MLYAWRLEPNDSDKNFLYDVLARACSSRRFAYRPRFHHARLVDRREIVPPGWAW